MGPVPALPARSLGKRREMVFFMLVSTSSGPETLWGTGSLVLVQPNDAQYSRIPRNSKIQKLKNFKNSRTQASTGLLDLLRVSSGPAPGLLRASPGSPPGLLGSPPGLLGFGGSRISKIQEFKTSRIARNSRIQEFKHFKISIIQELQNSRISRIQELKNFKISRNSRIQEFQELQEFKNSIIQEISSFKNSRTQGIKISFVP